MLGFLKKLFTSGADKQLLIGQMIKDGAVVVDVRTSDEFANDRYQHSRNIPLHLLDSKMADIKKWNKPVIVCCASGMRSNQAASMMAKAGIKVINAGSYRYLGKHF